MEAYLNTFLFGYYPYIAIFILIFGSYWRIKVKPRTVKSQSSQVFSKAGMRIGSNLFHIGVIVILLGHFVGLLTPEFVYEKFVTPTQKQLLAVTVGGIAGIVCFIGMTILVVRRFFNIRVSKNSSQSDFIILLLLYIQLILGLLTIPQTLSHHPDASTMVSWAEWLQHIVTFRSGAADFVSSISLIYKLHVLCGLTILVVFPFTRLIHIVVMPIGYLIRTGYQIVRI